MDQAALQAANQRMLMPMQLKSTTESAVKAVIVPQATTTTLREDVIGQEHDRGRNLENATVIEIMTVTNVATAIAIVTGIENENENVTGIEIEIENAIGIGTEKEDDARTIGRSLIPMLIFSSNGHQ